MSVVVGGGSCGAPSRRLSHGKRRKGRRSCAPPVGRRALWGKGVCCLPPFIIASYTEVASAGLSFGTTLKPALLYRAQLNFQANLNSSLLSGTVLEVCQQDFGK